MAGYDGGVAAQRAPDDGAELAGSLYMFPSCIAVQTLSCVFHRLHMFPHCHVDLAGS